MKRTLCIWLPDWPVQRLIGTRPELEAQLADREALEALASRCGRFSPRVAVEESAAPESLLLDVTGLAHLFGGEAALAEKVVGDFTHRGLTVRVAIADTLGAAWAVTHFHSSLDIQDSSFIIHNSSFTLVPPGEALAALRPLPVAALRLPEQVVAWLRQLGVDRIGQLEALPREELPSRFGPQLLERWDQALGRLAEPVPAHRPPPDLQADWSPESPTARRETIEAALQQLITRVAAMLVQRGRGVMQLECRLECRPEDPVQISVGVFEPTASAGHLFQLAQMQLERLRMAAPVSAIHVAATATAPLVRRQQELFGHGHGSSGPSSRHLASRYLAALVDRLSSRLGRRSVVRPRLVSDAQPELAWLYDPLVGDSRRRRLRKKAPVDLPPRPLRLLPRPVALAGLWEATPSAMTVIGGSIADGGDSHSLRFHFGGRQHQIAYTWGPERIETGWWRGRTVGRDYYRIETTTGRRFWLFRRLRDGRWFLHGMFD